MSDETRQEIMAVAPRSGGNVQAFIPRTAEEIKWTVGMILGAGLAPDSYNNDQKKIAVGIMKGLEVGLPPLSALANIAIINGRPTIWGDGAIALAQGHGLVAKMEENEFGPKPGEGAEVNIFQDEYGYEVKIWRRGQESPYIGRFTVGDAKRAKLWMNPKRAPWMNYPKRMLRMRAIGFAIRNGFADALAGMMIREEVEDLPPMKNVTPDKSYLDDAPKAIEAQPEIDTLDLWKIQTDDNEAFGVEFERQLADVVDSLSDVDALIQANESRLTDGMTEAAHARRKEFEPVPEDMGRPR